MKIYSSYSKSKVVRDKENEGYMKMFPYSNYQN